MDYIKTQQFFCPVFVWPCFYEPDWPAATFPNSAGFFSHIHHGKSPQKTRRAIHLKTNKKKKTCKVTGQVLCHVQSGRPDVFTTGRTGWYFSPVPAVTKGMCHRDTRLLFP